MTFFKAMTQYTGFLFFRINCGSKEKCPGAQSLFEWDVICRRPYRRGVIASAF